MLPPPSFVPFDDSNREHIGRIIDARWQKHRKHLLVSYMLPLVSLPLPELCLFIYTIVTLINIGYTMNRFRSLYADRKKDRKLRIPFHPEPYCIPETGHCYVRTNIIHFPYFPVDKETYYWMDPSQVLYLEMAPKSKILFDIMPEDELYSIKVDVDVTPAARVRLN
jgi:hypothetical protein